MTPLMMSAFCGESETVKLLLEHGADVNVARTMVRLRYLRKTEKQVENNRTPEASWSQRDKGPNSVKRDGIQVAT